MKKIILVATMVLFSFVSSTFATSINGTVVGSSTGTTNNNDAPIDLNSLLGNSTNSSTGSNSNTNTNTNTTPSTTSSNTGGSPSVDLNSILGTTGVNNTVLEKQDITIKDNKFSQLLKSNMIINIDITKDVNFSETFSVMIAGQEKIGRDIISLFDIKYTSTTGEELKLSADKDPILKAGGKLYVQPKSASTGGEFVDNQKIDFMVKNSVKFVDWGILNNDSVNSYIKYGVYSYVNSDGTPANTTTLNKDGTISVNPDILVNNETGVKENIALLLVLISLGLFFIRRKNLSV